MVRRMSLAIGAGHRQVVCSCPIEQQERACCLRLRDVVDPFNGPDLTRHACGMLRNWVTAQVWLSGYWVTLYLSKYTLEQQRDAIN